MTKSPFLMKLGDLELECINDLEAGFLVSDVKTYFMGGIDLHPGNVVFDVGANIGAFSAAVWSRLAGDVQLFAFEPMPPVREVLERNVESQLRNDVTVMPFGLGRQEEELDFNYFPAMTALSSSSRGEFNIEEERTRLTKTVLSMIDEGRAYPLLRGLPYEVVLAIVEGHVIQATQVRPYRAKIRTFSDVVRELKVTKVDLLKVDVEGAELEVLAGVAEEDWSMIRQVVLEVEQFAEREEHVHDLLKQHGFTVTSRQDAVERAGDYGMVYGLKPA